MNGELSILVSPHAALCELEADLAGSIRAYTPNRDAELGFDWKEQGPNESPVLHLSYTIEDNFDARLYMVRSLQRIESHQNVISVEDDQGAVSMEDRLARLVRERLVARLNAIAEDTDMEAFLDEAELVQKGAPPFSIMGRDALSGIFDDMGSTHQERDQLRARILPE